MAITAFPRRGRLPGQRAKQLSLQKELTMTARTKTRTTTVRLPERIYELARRVAEREKKGTSGVSASLNDLIVTAVTSYLNIYQRKQIDAAFAGMAEDADYQNEAKLLAEEFRSEQHTSEL